MPDSRGRAFVLKFEVILGSAMVFFMVIVVAFGFWLQDREEDRRMKADSSIREENLRINTIRSVENCNEIERVKHDIRLFILALSDDKVVRETANRRFAPIPGGSFINDRGEVQWRGCGEFPKPGG